MMQSCEEMTQISDSFSSLNKSAEHVMIPGP